MSENHKPVVEEKSAMSMLFKSARSRGMNKLLFVFLSLLFMTFFCNGQEKMDDTFLEKLDSNDCLCWSITIGNSKKSIRNTIYFGIVENVTDSFLMKYSNLTDYDLYSSEADSLLKFLDINAKYPIEMLGHLSLTNDKFDWFTRLDSVYSDSIKDRSFSYTDDSIWEMVLDFVDSDPPGYRFRPNNTYIRCERVCGYVFGKRFINPEIESRIKISIGEGFLVKPLGLAEFRKLGYWIIPICE
jgi:hypothetical protein